MLQSPFAWIYLDYLTEITGNSMDGGLEGHNISRTAPRWMCKYLYCREPSVFDVGLNSAYALSTQAVVVGEFACPLQSHIFQIFFDYLAEMAQTEHWKDIIYLGQPLDGPVSP